LTAEYALKEGVEAAHAVECGNGAVVRLCGDAIHAAIGDSDVEFAWNVAETASDERLLEPLIDAADVVHADLLRVKPDGGEPREHLTGGEVGGAASAAIRDFSDHRELHRGEHSVGHADAQHEEAGRPVCGGKSRTT